jgi:hypothetical protein
MKKVVIALAAFCLMSVSAFSQCATFPCVVASTSLPNQTQAITPTILFTPTVEGTFRVTAYLSTGGGTSTGNDWGVFLRWVDGQQARSQYVAVPDHSQNSPYATFVVHDLAGQPLEYRTGIFGGRNAGTPKKYDLYLVVEQLQ